MYNLLCAEFYKWKKSKAFYGCILTAVGIIIMIWLSFLLANGIETGQIENGTMGVTVSGELPDSGEQTSLFDEFGVMDMVQTIVGGGVSTLFMSVFICIWVIGEYTGGAIKNTIGKGYLRSSIFIAKYVSTLLAALVLNIVIILTTAVAGIAVMGTGRMEAHFWQNLLAYAGVELMLGAAFGGIIAAVSEYARTMAAGISISIFLYCFSGLIANGFDLLFRVLDVDFRVSDYWITCVIESCPATTISMDFVGRAVYVTVLWSMVSLLAGVVHFHQSDIG